MVRTPRADAASDDAAAPPLERGKPPSEGGAPNADAPRTKSSARKPPARRPPKAQPLGASAAADAPEETRSAAVEAKAGASGAGLSSRSAVAASVGGGEARKAPASAGAEKDPGAGARGGLGSPGPGAGLARPSAPTTPPPASDDAGAGLRPGAGPQAHAPTNPKVGAATSASPEASTRPTGGEVGADPLSLFDGEQRKAIETLSLNLARASLTAQGALATALAGRGGVPSADPFHVGPALSEVMGKLALHPERVMRAQADLFGRYLDLWVSTAKKAAGESADPVAGPARGDKRFLDPDWSVNPVFDAMKQSYLLTSDWLHDLVAGVEDVDPAAKRRVEFFTRMLTDAFSPSNFLLSNPVALREAVRTQGQSLLKGAETLAADLQKGGGQLAISQTKADMFKVGENIATAPGQVVARNELFELLQFSPSTEQVFEVPLLIFPPWINKYYILDLRAENSMIRWLTGQGFTVFVTSWVNPGPDMADKTLTDYLHGGVYTAVEQVLRQTGSDRVNTVGYCIGGTLLACALAHMAVKEDRRIASATFFAAQQDFSEAGDLLLFTDDAWVSDLEARIDAAGGVSPAAAMADTFNALRANDLIWSFFVNNYLLGREPAAFDLLFWNSDQTQMPKALHLSYLRDFYKANRLAKGELEMDGVRLDLSAVKVPIYVQSSKEDHIAPFRSVYRGARLFGGPVRFILAGSGHIAGVINHPDARKYQHWTNDAFPEDVDAWRAGAQESPGSWWPDWKRWLETRSGAAVAPRDPHAGPLPVLGDAPGSYVKRRSGS